MMPQIQNIVITPEILKLISELDEFKGQWRVMENLAPDRLNKLRRVATIESVGSSTRIEGSRLTDADVERLLSNLETKSFTTRDEQEVAGYASAMDLVFESYESISVSENHIKQLHAVLLKYSAKDEEHRGEYKKVSNSVEAFGVDGKSLGIVFETTSPFETPIWMKNLVEWYNEAISSEESHPLILIAIFVVVFLAIHPFKDGNGRISRVLTTLLLLRTGYSYSPYSSMESVIEANKDNYYLALRRTQQSLRSKVQMWEPWLVFFLKCMVKQKNNLALKTTEEQTLKLNLPVISRKILDCIKSRGEASVREIEEETKANRNTIKVHLKSLVKQQYLTLLGRGRGVRYVLK